MREKLKKINLRLTEFAHYLDISRPTLYKYLEEYESNKYKDIDKKTKRVFDFIKKPSTISKIAVIDFIINQIKDDTPEAMVSLYNAIDKDNALSNLLLHDIHNIGVNGVKDKIKTLYRKEPEND